MAYNRFEDPKHIKWAKAVKKRDNFACQICGTKSGYLNSHHRNSWDLFESERFNVNNGITLCQKHHNMFHQIYGTGKNTEVQFEQFKKICNIIIELVKKKGSDTNGRGA